MRTITPATEKNTTVGSYPGLDVAADASELGFPVGRCLKKVETTLGNKQPFVLERIERKPCGEAIKAVFKQAFGCLTLHVYNT